MPEWLRRYRLTDLPHDLVASATLLVLLVPQGLAYALLAGLPPQAGLYASIAPVLVYALFGSSATLSVGPAALPSLMTATALAGLAIPGSSNWVGLAAMVALLSGLLRLALAGLKFGFVANFLSQSVVGGFVAGSAVLIVLSQSPHLFGVSVHGATAWEILVSLVNAWAGLNKAALMLSVAALALLLAGKRWTRPLLQRLGMQTKHADLAAKAFPIVVVALGGIAVSTLQLGVRVVGHLPQGLPPLAWPNIDLQAVQAILPAVLAIALVGFVDSFSIAQSLALKRRETVNPDRELLALGAANAAAGLTGGFPVSASFGRSAANELAGARTQLAGVLSAGWMALVLLVFTDLFASLPLAVLAATIVTAVTQMIDLSVLKLAWRYDRRDAVVYLATFAAVLLLGVVDAILLGVALSLALFIWRTSQPHLAVLGRVPGTEHYRNILRHNTHVVPEVLAIRVDESLYFANIRFVRTRLIALLRERSETRHLLLVLSAVNAIDVSALQGLRELNQGLLEQRVDLHLAEVKGPVMDLLKQSGFLDELSGIVHLSTYTAMQHLSADHYTDYVI
ncbi:SulP family inorganic anion transporter [Chitinimonas sp. BJB300]|uniref:SulP family inorganic anion transporter n=1 Tax=Chitinimonas sp. BJB300 TaxID=1559339 RepID=UPI000C1164DF|nr:sulfate permease [Chitinimonas sp. BJB300]PHV12897.1 sodium-independent anion transporter [Chitinimonas sp. BJB300]TSJ88466.1 sulfate permease [Chitinimonas sp. BJB300]